MLYKLENLQRIHGRRTILDIEYLEIVPNSIYTLIGPNGAGKTSLLKILAFLDKPSSGRLHFSGHPVKFNEKHLHSLRNQVVLFDQNPILFSGTVRDNVAFGLKVRKVDSDYCRLRVDEMLTLVGMDRFADCDSQGLSGGEVKRVALARSLAVRPAVLLCDEPTANVDGENQQIILNTLKQINRDEKTSIIFSTHYLSQGQRLADHTLLLQNGSLSDMVNENIFKVKLSGQNEEYAICALSPRLSIKLPTAQVPVNTKVAKLFIDPAKIVINHGGKDLAGGNYLDGEIYSLSIESSMVRLGIDVGVRLTLILPLAQYHKDKMGLGDKKTVFIPDNSVVCTS